MIKNNKSDCIYGLHTVTAVITHQPERCKKLFIARKSDVATLENLCRARGIPYELIDRNLLERKFGVSSDAQGVVLQCSAFHYADLDEAIEQTSILVLDSWQDPVNLGRAARSAVAFGIGAMVICKDRSAEINAASEKSAVGALAQLKVVRVVNLAAALKKMQTAGFFLYGADEAGETELRKCDFARKAALVIGQEGEGLRELTKKTCDVLVRIPMASPDICLNAADAALLMMYELKS